VDDSLGVWTLRGHDGRKLADLVVIGRDFPWLNARVGPFEGFKEVLPLFRVPR
jgi:hypothetical protein